MSDEKNVVQRVEQGLLVSFEDQLRKMCFTDYFISNELDDYISLVEQAMKDGEYEGAYKILSSDVYAEMNNLFGGLHDIDLYMSDISDLLYWGYTDLATKLNYRLLELAWTNEIYNASKD